MCVCVCVRERKRGREGGGEGGRVCEREWAHFIFRIIVWYNKNNHSFVKAQFILIFSNVVMSSRNL